MDLMASMKGKPKDFKNLKRFSEEYGLDKKKLNEFNELDKIVFQNIKLFIKLI